MAALKLVWESVSYGCLSWNTSIKLNPWISEPDPDIEAQAKKAMLLVISAVERLPSVSI
jgi:hypothetical protein